MYSPTPSPRRGTRLLLALLPSSAIFLLLFVLSAVSVTTLKKNPKTTDAPHLRVHKHFQVAHSACEGTLYPELCVSTLLSVPDLASKRVPELISVTINRTLSELRASSSNCSSIGQSYPNFNTLEKRAINDCLELFHDTIVELKSALNDLSPKKLPSKHYHDLQTLFSGAMTNQYTCLDGFAYSDGNVRDVIKSSLYNISRHVSNSLVMLKKIPGDNMSSKYEKSVNLTKFDLIVAKDGSGNFTTITEAVEAAPNKSNTRFVIYIKAGAYFENVEVDKKKTMLMFVGDGIGKTVVKANRSVVDGWTTFRSATVAVVGTGFIAKGITVENSAGPSKHQAVALRSGSDLSAFYKCSFVGYQDTLYVHSLRQFYRECDVYGTVDFIFGNAAVVFQICNLYARKPNANQKNIITAQGREDPNQNTGISILNCKVAAASDLIPYQTEFKTYLGRPWKEYSRTVFMLSYLGDLIAPAGWLEWNGTFALSTLFYGEYKNRGPGSNTSARVTWPGYRVINNSAVAAQFTAGPFLQGSEWLNSTGIPFYLNLTP
ncbi:Pectinesterase [Citrus sinensis]|uniref:Pectinesterase n=1 Tax=Citrus sinensis TaxID=2711 RepID=A0ACB8MLP6_CITSI|nr:Pectinesterase [Citrus sinensis]KAH9786548.1 Pectinesterase [Citrus sinensis]